MTQSHLSYFYIEIDCVVVSKQWDQFSINIDKMYWFEYIIIIITIY